MGGLKRIRKDDAGIALWSLARRSVKAQADVATAASAVEARAKPWRSEPQNHFTTATRRHGEAQHPEESGAKVFSQTEKVFFLPLCLRGEKPYTDAQGKLMTTPPGPTTSAPPCGTTLTALNFIATFFETLTRCGSRGGRKSNTKSDPTINIRSVPLSFRS
jgi:hypothetical protein